MSSFNEPHYLYLFDLRNGKKKLAYGRSPEDALEILSFRLPPEEMAAIIPERYVQISPRNLFEYISLLG